MSKQQSRQVFSAVPFSFHIPVFCIRHKRISNSRCCSCYVWSLSVTKCMVHIHNLVTYIVQSSSQRSTMSGRPGPELTLLLQQTGLIAGDVPDDLTPLPSRTGSPVQDALEVVCGSASRSSKLAELPLLPAATNQLAKSSLGPSSLTSGSPSSNAPSTPGKPVIISMSLLNLRLTVEAIQPLQLETANVLDPANMTQANYLSDHINDLQPQNTLIQSNIILTPPKDLLHLDSRTLLLTSPPGPSGQGQKRPRISNMLDSPKSEPKRPRIMKSKQIDCE